MYTTYVCVLKIYKNHGQFWEEIYLNVFTYKIKQLTLLFDDKCLFCNLEFKTNLAPLLQKMHLRCISLTQIHNINI